MREPPGKAVNPLEFVAPEFGEFQYNVPVDLSAPPALYDPPRKLINVLYSEFEGKCQSIGQMPWLPSKVV